VAFSTTPDPVVAPTKSRGEVRDLIEGLRPESATATGDALAAALRTLRPNGRRRGSPAAIVLLSDGKRTTGQDPVGVAREARRLRVPIYTVALGDPGAVIIVPGTSAILPVPPDPETMRRVARESGGRAFAVDDADRLRTVYEGLGSTLGSRTQRRQVTAAFAAAGGILLLAAAALSTRRFGLLP
jgi:Ca-activated chloride channel family protein